MHSYYGIVRLLFTKFIAPCQNHLFLEMQGWYLLARKVSPGVATVFGVYSRTLLLVKALFPDFLFIFCYICAGMTKQSWSVSAITTARVFWESSITSQ